LDRTSRASSSSSSLTENFSFPFVIRVIHSRILNSIRSSQEEEEEEEASFLSFPIRSKIGYRYKNNGSVFTQSRFGNRVRSLKTISSFKEKPV
jgi:hypothetical protein